MKKLNELDNREYISDGDYSCYADEVKDNPDYWEVGWYTTKKEHLRLDAKELLEEEFLRMEENGEAYEDFQSNAMKQIDLEQIVNLQKVLDEIMTGSVFDAYDLDEEIENDMKEDLEDEYNEE